MNDLRHGLLATVLALASSVAMMAIAHAQGVLGTLANNDSVFIDGRTFAIVAGKARANTANETSRLGARELGPGALIFRFDNRLYLAGIPRLAGFVSDSDIARQQPLGLHDADSVRQQPQGTRDNAAGGHRVYITDPEYAHYELAKTFEDNWTTTAHSQQDEGRTNRILIDYVVPKNPAHEKLYELLKERHVLETLQQIFAPLRLPLDVTIRTVGCDGVSNAWYDRQGKKPVISLCYEYLQEIMDKMPKGTTPAGLSPTDVVVGQLFYAALHELGHASFDLLDVPVLGREEDAADQFAAYFMLRFGGDRARRLIGGAAYSYAGFVKDHKNNPNVTLPLLAFSSNHGSPEERFYNLVCIAYGSDSTLFADVVDKGYLPESRAKGCRYEYQVLAWAIRNQIVPHIDQAMAKKVLDTQWVTRPISPPAPHG